MDDFDKAELDRKVAAFKERQTARIEQVKGLLRSWIEEQTDLPPGISDPAASPDAFAISVSLLETALDRFIQSHGPTDALDFIEGCFQRRAEKFRQSLQ